MKKTIKKLTLILILVLPALLMAQGDLELRINAGGPEITFNNTLFLANQYNVSPGGSYINSANISPPYNSEWYASSGPVLYEFPIDNGDYQVILHFAEIYHTTVASRVFDVYLESTLVRDDLDIVAEVGANTPLVLTYNVTLNDGFLNLRLSSIPPDGGIENPKISAIEIIGLGGPNTGTGGHWIKTDSNVFYNDGGVGVGDTINTIPAGYKMAIAGNIIAEEIRVELSNSWPDYVFTNDYNLPSFNEIREHIKKEGHLPNIPSAEEVSQKGLQLGEMNRRLVEKIEEQMLYILQLEERMAQLEKNIKSQP